MADVISFDQFQKTRGAKGPDATQVLLSQELAPGVTVHAAAWAFAMPEAEYQRSDIDIERMAQLLQAAGLHLYGGNEDQPPALVLIDEYRFHRFFQALGCREECLTALGTGILIKRHLAWSK